MQPDSKDPITELETPKFASESEAQRSTLIGGPGVPPALRANESPARIGRFDVGAILGEGAFGRVYWGFDPELKREVAIKVPHRDGLTSGFRERFLREARAAATIHHPNVCPIYDIGTDGDLPYLVMHFVSGPTLASLLARRDGSLPPREAVEITRDLALGVAAAHAVGVIHRDLKPQNVLVDEARRQVFITDFGIAKVGSEPGLTGEGDVLGTPVYMSPEQACGNLAAVGPLSDVYSLGVILYRMLTGETPFHGTVTEVLAQVREVSPPPPSATCADLDSRLDALCLKAMAKDPTQRFMSAMAFASALGEFLKAAPGEASIPVASSEQPVAPSHSDRRTRRSGRWAWVGLAITLLGALAILPVLWNPFRKLVENPVTQNPPDGPPAPVLPVAPMPRAVPDRFADHKFDQAAERRAAEWVLSLSGRIEIRPHDSSFPVEVFDAQHLPPHFRLTGLTIINHPGVTDEQIKANITGISGPIRINLSGCRKVTDEAVKVFANIPVLMELLLNDAGGVTDESLRALSGHPTLESLGLVATRVTVNGLTHLQSLPALTHLGLGELPVTDEWLVRVAQLENLEMLYLNDNRTPDRFTATGLAHLKSLGKLRGLALMASPINGDGLRELAALPTLESIGLDGTAIRDADLAALKTFPQLKFVNLQLTRVTDEGMAHLAACPKLESVELAGTEVGDPGAQELARSGTIKMLNLTRTRITNTGLKSLASLKTLDDLVLWNTQVSDGGVEFLLACPNLKRLHFNMAHITDASVPHFAKMQKLEWLVLRNTKVSDKSVKLLSEMRQLRFLNLTGSEITPDGLSSLRTALQPQNCTVGDIPPRN